MKTSIYPDFGEFFTCYVDFLVFREHDEYSIRLISCYNLLVKGVFRSKTQQMK